MVTGVRHLDVADKEHTALAERGVLRGRRVTLRPLEPTDLDWILALLNEPGVRQWCCQVRADGGLREPAAPRKRSGRPGAHSFSRAHSKFSGISTTLIGEPSFADDSQTVSAPRG